MYLSCGWKVKTWTKKIIESKKWYPINTCKKCLEKMYKIPKNKNAPSFNKANLRNLIAATGLEMLLKIGFKSSIFQPVCPWNLMDDLEKQWGTSILCQALWIISKPSVNSNLSHSPETINSGQNWHFFLSHVNLKFDEWPWKTIGHLFYTTSNFVHHFKAISEFKLELQSGNPQFGSKSTIFFSCVTLKFDRWPSKIIRHLS